MLKNEIYQLLEDVSKTMSELEKIRFRIRQCIHKAVKVYGNIVWTPTPEWADKIKNDALLLPDALDSDDLRVFYADLYKGTKHEGYLTGVELEGKTGIALSVVNADTLKEHRIELQDVFNPEIILEFIDKFAIYKINEPVKRLNN